MFVEEEDSKPDKAQTDSNQFGRLEGPGDVWQVVQQDVWKWRIFRYVRQALMGQNHDERRDAEGKEGVDGADNDFPNLWIQFANWGGGKWSTGLAVVQAVQIIFRKKTRTGTTRSLVP